MDLKGYADVYKKNLLEDVIPFWLQKSRDEKFGGYFTSIDQTGNIFDTDKFIWLQCRQVWTFAMLYNRVEKRKEWLDFAIHGAEFLLKHGRDNQGNWYFSLNQKGDPLVLPYNIFSDCFASMAFGQLYQATNNPQYCEVAVNTFFNILKRQDNPKGKYSKVKEDTRPLKNFALPMILCNLVLEIENLLDSSLVDDIIQKGIHSVMNVFYQPQMGVILENVSPDGKFSNSYEGRITNPGHGLEAMWFIMDLAERSKNEELIQKAIDISLKILNYAWDDKYGGIYYFLDVKGYPPQQLEWDQKLWWVHIEAIITVLKGYLHTGDENCLEWFEKIHKYTWRHFPDSLHGEWFGYLNRRGEILLPLKGGKWKGCFHVPRGLYQGWQTLEQITKCEVQTIKL
jgi:N-acylglucosamine 2-epimerase